MSGNERRWSGRAAAVQAPRLGGGIKHSKIPASKHVPLISTFSGRRGAQTQETNVTHFANSSNLVARRAAPRRADARTEAANRGLPDHPQPSI
jgi:hypothetical protein